MPTYQRNGRVGADRPQMQAYIYIYIYIYICIYIYVFYLYVCMRTKGTAS